MTRLPPFTAERRLGDMSARVVDLHATAEGRLRHMPVLHRILLENLVRCGGHDAEHARRALLGWLDTRASTAEIPLLPGRILMHDTTCGPALVDIAAMRAVIAEAGGDPCRLRPLLPVDVSTDHSVAVDVFGVSDATRRNMMREMEKRRALSLHEMGVAGARHSSASARHGYHAYAQPRAAFHRGDDRVA